MAFDGSGVFNRLFKWTQDAANSINITASRVDSEDDGFAAGLTNCVTRDGQGKMAADFLPATDFIYNLGSNTKRWATLNGIPVANFTVPTQASIGAILYPVLGIEGATVVNAWYPYGNILRYGTNTTPGTTNMTAAITAAIAFAMAGGGPVIAPPGIYLYTAQIVTAFPAALTDISIIGAGANLTEFRCSAASGGLAFTWNTELNTVHIRDIAFTTSVANGGTALAFNYNSFGSASSLSDVENCVFRGSDGYNVAFYWTNGVVQNDTSALNIDNCTFFGKGTFAAGATGCSGTGVVVQGINSSNLGILTNVTRCNFMFLHQGINYGGAVGFYQGLSVATTNFTLCDYGIVQSAGQVSDAQLAVTGSQFACNFDISLLSGIVGTNIVGNYFISQFTGDIAITIAGQYDFSIANNYFQSLSTAANVTAVSINTVALTFSPAPSTGATSGTYAAPLIYAAGQAFSIVTSTGQSLRAFFTGLGNANLSWFPAITGSPTTAATLTAGVGVIQGNVIDNYSVGINLNPNTAGVLVTANVFNTPGAVVINNQGPATVAAFLVPNSVTNNPGFLTSNKGVTGAIATGATVAHGLAVTPTIVLLQAQDGTPTAVFPGAPGATTFTVNYAGGGTHAFSWQASIANVG
jgi:hypothetical protein